MPRLAAQLRADALQIWHAGLDAVRSQRLVREAVTIEHNALRIQDTAIDLRRVGRIVVVGAGKAGGGMAEALEEVIGPRLLEEKQVKGWVNVPADCVRPLQRIHLHAARAAGQNEPAAEGVHGAEQILKLVGQCAEDDLCLCLLSGGASALLPAPAAGITLADKLAVTRHLSAVGANIRELNTVRKQLSRIKGGGLLRACGAGQLVSLIISDVMGDPLDVIGSGPTTPDTSSPAEALAILRKYKAAEAGISPAVFDFLSHKQVDVGRPRCQYRNYIIGNNARAVEASGVMAQRLGYHQTMHCATELEGPAEEVGRHLAQTALRMRAQDGPDCLISGGEPVVKLVPQSERGLGGRNQQLALAALLELADASGIALLSGATDGEDGPTDAAGAVIDADLMCRAVRLKLDAPAHLARNDAYHFFAALDGLIKTGPTDTNVGDLRIVVVDRGSK
jgi:hydroxypyruvate reductase